MSLERTRKRLHAKRLRRRQRFINRFISEYGKEYVHCWRGWYTEYFKTRIWWAKQRLSSTIKQHQQETKEDRLKRNQQERERRLSEMHAAKLRRLTHA